MSTLDEIHSADFVECTLVVVLLKKNNGAHQLFTQPSRHWQWILQQAELPALGVAQVQDLGTALAALRSWWLGTAGQLTTGTVLGANSFGHFAVEAELPHFSLEGESKCLELEHTWHEIS